MADPVIELIPDERRAQEDDKRQRTFGDAYRVLYSAADAETLNQEAVLDDFSRLADIKIGSPFPPGWVKTEGDPYPSAFCRGLTVDPAGDADENGVEWKVSVEYGQIEYDPVDGVFLDPPVLSGDVQIVQVPLDFDREGKPILNTAYDPFDPTIMGEESQAVFNVEVNRPMAYWRQLYTHNNTVNKYEWLGIPPRCAKVAVRWTVQRDQTVGYYLRMSYQFLINRYTWDVVVPSLGRRQLVSGVRKPILTGGVAVTEPVKLDANGNVM
jgi:hypothetical protein